MKQVIKHFYDKNMKYLGNIIFCTAIKDGTIYLDMDEGEYVDMLNKKFPNRRHCITNIIKK